MAANRGDVYWAFLDPVLGTEQKGRRPVVVISPNELNYNLDRAIVAPLTTQRRDYPTFIPIDLESKTAYAMLDQIRTLDTKRLKKRIGSVSQSELDEILSRLRVLFS